MTMELHGLELKTNNDNPMRDLDILTLRVSHCFVISLTALFVLDLLGLHPP